MSGEPELIELEPLRKLLHGKKGATEEFPFGPEAMVIKVMGKMFALVGHAQTPLRISLKCDPDLALALRMAYEAVTPAYHMNKKHWNTVILDGTVPDEEIVSMIDDSYDLVVKGLKKADKEKLKETA
jgi:predicted DNA-binding protein (MmcQ/YjbR family)